MVEPATPTNPFSALSSAVRDSSPNTTAPAKGRSRRLRRAGTQARTV